MVVISGLAKVRSYNADGEGVGFVVALPQLNGNGSFHEQEDPFSDRSLLHQELALFGDVFACG